MTAGLVGQSGEACEDVGNEQVRLDSGAEHKRVVGVTLGGLQLTRRDRDAGADRQRRRRVSAGCRREGLVGAAAGDGEIPVCQRGLGTPDAPHRRLLTNDDSHVLAGGLARLVRGRSIPGGQGGVSQDRVPECREPSAKLRGGLEVSPQPPLAPRPPHPGMRVRCSGLPRLITPPDLIVSRLGLGRHLAELCDGSGQIATNACADPRLKRHRRELNLSPIASARSRPSSAAARTASGSPAVAAPFACKARIWLSLHRSPIARARPIASAKYGPGHLGVVAWRR